MKVLALVAILFALAASQPHPRCASPKQWEGIGFQLTPGRGTYAGVLVSYDLINQKYRSLANITTFNNSSKPTIELVDYIFDYEKEIFYQINLDNKTCQESTLSGSLPPIEVPATASYIAQLWIGVEGLLGAGLETELWMGTPSGLYAGLWTEVGCIPVMQTLSFNTSQLINYSHVTLYNVTLGIKDPGVFTPPSYCK